MNFLPKLSPLWIRVLRRLAATCRRSEQLPSSLRIVDHHDVTWLHGDQESTNIDDRKAFTHNGQADIFKCRHEGRAIAVKDYRISSGESMKVSPVLSGDLSDVDANVRTSLTRLFSGVGSLIATLSRSLVG